MFYTLKHSKNRLNLNNVPHDIPVHQAGKTNQCQSWYSVVE